MTPDELYEIYRNTMGTDPQIPPWEKIPPVQRRGWVQVSIAVDEERTAAEDHGYADGYTDGEDDNS